MSPEIKREIDALKREIADLKKQLPNGRINTIMNVKDDQNTFRAVQRALLTSSLSIGNAGQTGVEESSILTLNGKNKGFLPTRNADATTIDNPVEGLITYSTNQEALMVYNGDSWGQTLPRYTDTNMLAIPTPLDGQIVYNTTHDAPAWRANGTWGFILPQMSTTNRNALTAPSEGQMIYNTTTDKLNVYANGAWQQVTSV